MKIKTVFLLTISISVIFSQSNNFPKLYNQLENSKLCQNSEIENQLKGKLKNIILNNAVSLKNNIDMYLQENKNRLEKNDSEICIFNNGGNKISRYMIKNSNYIAVEKSNDSPSTGEIILQALIFISIIGGVICLMLTIPSL